MQTRVKSRVQTFKVMSYSHFNEKLVFETSVVESLQLSEFCAALQVHKMQMTTYMFIHLHRSHHVTTRFL